MFFTHSSSVHRRVGHGAFIFLLLNAVISSAAEPPASNSAAGSVTAPAYPRTLSAAEMQAHFDANPKIKARADGVGNIKSFTITFRSNGWYNGVAPTGGVTFGGTWKISGANARLCLTPSSTLNGTVDIGGCYALQQTGARSFVLANKSSWIAYGEQTGWGSLNNSLDRAPKNAAPVEATAAPILIDITSRKITPEMFKRAAISALGARGWNITSSTPDQIDGSLIKGKEYRVSILYRQEAIIKIAFVSGYGMESQGWLKNLQRDMESEFLASN